MCYNVVCKLLAVSSVLIAVVFIQGCASHSSNQAWGSRVTIPDMSRLATAFDRAVRDDATWLPLAGAVVSGVTSLDENVSDWAIRETPVFGSNDKALDVSDDLMHLSRDIMVVSVLLTPNSSSVSNSLEGKFKGATFQFLAVGATNTLTGILKRGVGRSRPARGNSGNDSFPSAHASSAYVYTSLARTNYLPLISDPLYRDITDYSLSGIAAATAWARVEGGVHYPSDVLFAAALGNFMTVFFNHAFTVTNDSVSPSVLPGPERDSLVFGLEYHF